MYAYSEIKLCRFLSKFNLDNRFANRISKYQQIQYNTLKIEIKILFTNILECYYGDKAANV